VEQVLGDPAEHFIILMNFRRILKLFPILVHIVYVHKQIYQIWNLKKLCQQNINMKNKEIREDSAGI
jgi:hypothetical protein